jgi:UDP-N-acetyl-D-glucosamine dehydrogenase
MKIDVWEAIDAAATKPFGFMPFAPGPGVGGHCIPVDPYYLSWKARAYDFNTKLIALATEINEQMPHHVADRVTEAVNARLKRSIEGARILAVGVAYKGRIADVRESPAVKVLSLLRRRGASIAYHDPYVPRVLVDEQECASVPLTPEAMADADCVVILTDHVGIDYARIVEHASLVFDTRNATRVVADPHGKILRL